MSNKQCIHFIWILSKDFFFQGNWRKLSFFSLFWGHINFSFSWNLLIAFKSWLDYKYMVLWHLIIAYGLRGPNTLLLFWWPQVCDLRVSRRFLPPAADWGVKFFTPIIHFFPLLQPDIKRNWERERKCGNREEKPTTHQIGGYIHSSTNTNLTLIIWVLISMLKALQL